MFGWFRPSCPCDPAAKAWVEERLQWLADEFEDNAFVNRPVVLPTPDYFPDPYDGSKRAVRAMLDRVCDYMGVVPDLVALKFLRGGENLRLVNEADQDVPTHAAGTYSEGKRKYIVRVHETGLDQPMALAGTLAHELAHVRLLGEGRALSEAYDNELLTDLTVVFLGMGVFLANVPRNWDSAYSKWPDSDLRKPEYMTPPMFGYALAHLAWHRDDPDPAWRKHLNWGARANFKQGLRYLQTSSDSSFRPWHARLGPEA